ncbi:MAG: cation diffusion facilitator family transporter [Oscillospiraceae bacterium]|nr:cation diffusion facilitator family transporter [Oscillospiraceae bacterium]
MENTRTDAQIAYRVSLQTIAGNVVLSAFKLLAGLLGNSAAMVSDAAHSLSDILSTVFVMVGIRMSGRKADKDHPYGHERMECVAAIVLAAVLCATGLLIGWQGVSRILEGASGQLAVPGALALVAAVVSVAVKEGMYWYTRAAAQKTGSGALMADAWHHRSDALSSVGSFAGILGARLGLPILDPLACLVITVFIVKTALNIFLDAVGKMTDRACDDETVEQLRAVILSQEGVRDIDRIHTRLFGSRVFVDVEISVDGGETLRRAHETAHRVHDAIENGFPQVKHCMVHVNPSGNAE